MSKEQIPQRKLGTALRDFFEHVTSHDEEGVHAAPAEPGAPEQINGVPDALAQMMIEEVPGFEKAWVDALRAKRLQTMISQVVDVVQQAKEQAAEAKGMEAVKPEVDALIEKLKGKQ